MIATSSLNRDISESLFENKNKKEVVWGGKI